MKKIVLILGILFFLISCNNNDLETSPESSSPESLPGSPITFSTIGQYNLYGNGDENISKSNLVISDAISWKNLIAKMNTRNNVSNNFTETNIDFTKYQIIAIFDKIQPSGGHSIDITLITENQKDITIKIEKLKTGDATLVMTQPFHIVKIAKSDKTIIFSEKK
ncbi:protease complex subunit PrcB family protein [Flavobacterium sp. DGU38]|uniref:Protease complex subunit PrcB family protein n=1 Tax=Flavobacterium calami TaxID=3139144 RepID=A0ABU9IUF3_9FLAO